ncbi:MAG: GNAT family N-acetyltransferase, partial [Thermomicrobiales bacterium]|nr:GNAT family N-acetyltransferase [Thermomicrobiales bacterium]
VARARPVFEELVALHQQRWTAAGYTGSFASSRFLGFHRTLIANLLGEGRIVLYRATAGEQVLGTFYGFVERGSIYHYQWGLAQFEDNNLSPGFVVGALCMQEALDRGYDEVNWLAGDVRYKRELSTTSRELIWAEWQRGPWMTAVNALIGARRWVRSHARRSGGDTGETGS